MCNRITVKLYPILIDFPHLQQGFRLALAGDVFIRPLVIPLGVAMHLQKCLLLRRPSRPVRVATDRQLDAVSALHKNTSHDLPPS